MKNKRKICLFFNHERGLKITQYFLNLKNYEITKVFLSQKNLNKKILPLIKQLSLNYQIIKKIDSHKIVKFVKKHNVDLNIISGFPYIFKKELLNSSKYGTLNLHGGKLPQYKGASTLNWQIINGEKRIGISIIKANSSIDGGDILSQYSFNLKDNHDISEVHKIVNKKFPILLKHTLEKYFNNNIKLKKNNGGKIYKQRSIKDGKIKWNYMSNVEVFNFIRGITKPYPGAFSFIGGSGKKIIIFKSLKSKLNPKILPGKVFIKKEKIFVKCLSGSIRIVSSSIKLKKKYLLI